MTRRGGLTVYRGTLASFATTSGHRFVATVWDETPDGRWCGLLVAEPGGSRTLLVGDPDHVDAVAQLHDLDRIEIVDLSITRAHGRWTIDAAGAINTAIVVEVGAGTLRGRAVARLPRRVVETRGFACFTEIVLRVGSSLVPSWRRVHAAGTLRAGAGEFHCARSERRIDAVAGTFEGRDLGTLTSVGACGFGFSDPPRTPAVGDMTALRTR